MSEFKILPSILAADHGRFLQEVETVNMPGIDTLHVDIMDGHFVPNITFGPQVVASLRNHTDFHLDVHLMFENVASYVPQFAEAGANIITIHQEATAHLDRSLALIRECGAKAGVAVNPATPLDTLRWVLDKVDLVLIMSVNPGFGAQKFIETSLEKIKRIRELKEKHDYQYIIEVDGGIDEKTAPQVTAAGASYLVAGNAVFGKKNRKSANKAIDAAVKERQARDQLIYT